MKCAQPMRAIYIGGTKTRPRYGLGLECSFFLNMNHNIFQYGMTLEKQGPEL